MKSGLNYDDILSYNKNIYKTYLHLYRI